MSTQYLIEGLRAPDKPRRRIILACDALDKAGKTRFALSAPKPLVYLDTDMGGEGTQEKADNYENGVITCDPFMFLPYEATWNVADDDATRTREIIRAAEPHLERFRQVYLDSLNKPVMKVNGKELKARTIVIDTGSDIWQLARLCYLGKLTKVMPHHYTEVNGFMRDLVKAAYKTDVNVIWLHKLKAEWKEGGEGKARKTGVMERDGFEGMSYLVQANLLAYRIPSTQTTTQTVQWRSGEGLFGIDMEPRAADDLGFRLVVGNSRHDPNLESTVWENDAIDFRIVAQTMLPDSDPSDWADSV